MDHTSRIYELLGEINVKVDLIAWLHRIEHKLDRLLADRSDQARIEQASDKLDQSTTTLADAVQGASPDTPPVP